MGVQKGRAMVNQVNMTITEAPHARIIVEVDPGRRWPTLPDGSLDVDRLTRAESAALYAAQCIQEAGRDGGRPFTFSLLQ